MLFEFTGSRQVCVTKRISESSRHPISVSVWLCCAVCVLCVSVCVCEWREPFSVEKSLGRTTNLALGLAFTLTECK
jgi:hypothetical protein